MTVTLGRGVGVFKQQLRSAGGSEHLNNNYVRQGGQSI